MTKDYLNNSSTVTVSEWVIAHLIMMVPIVNIVMLLKWSLSDQIKPSKSNWAKLQLILMVIGLLIGGTYILFYTISLGALSQLN